MKKLGVLVAIAVLVLVPVQGEGAAPCTRSASPTGREAAERAKGIQRAGREA